MKSKFICLAILLAATGVVARIIVPFRGWDNLESSSEVIAVVRCGKPIGPVPGVFVDNAPNSISEIEVIAFLKGTNGAVTGRLETDRYLHQGMDYLVFAYLRNGVYRAFESYKAIPIGDHFPTNSVSGKPLHEQIKILSEDALFHLNREIQQDEEQKAQLDLLVGNKIQEKPNPESPLPK